ncbi:MAG: Asp-tRNA(Asn)/Glu-tRNA(Gln) amidotransferase subunit GatA [Spirochaetaceae bacterium]|nr:Asp-tRNA(Asn)/Glu-tRNA(Gln) amidotransferase subunit GatA [Spirochaetaceae bacterium]
MIWNNVLKNTEYKKKYVEYVKNWEEKIHSLLVFDPDRPTPGKAEGGSALSNIPYVVKDNIAVKDFRFTCGSKILENFVSLYDAAVIEKLNTLGAVPIGKSNMDEFGMGSSTDNSALAITNNPWDLERVAGGSSGGSAAAVAAGITPFALGTDTGGSIRQPASFCGVYGLKPTYGSVSRYGAVAYASSLDVIGVLARDISMTETVFDLIKGKDEQDQTTTEYIEDKRNLQKPVFGYLVGDLGLSDSVAKAYKNCIDILKSKGYEVKEIAIPSLEYVIPAYYTISTAEASANLAKFNGIRYGYRSKGTESPLALMKKSRSEGFGEEVKLRILLGTYVLRSGFQDKYYIKAQKIRTKIINDFNNIFGNIDLVVAPAFPTAAFRHGNADLSPYQQRLADKFSAIANLAGIPALSFPAGVYDNLPVGLQFFAPHYSEKLLFNAAKIIAEEIPVPKVPGFKTIEEICEAPRG